MLKRSAVFVLALLPLAAGAQPVPNARLAQAASGTQGITVQGRGLVRFAVKTIGFVAQTRGNADESSVLAAMRAAGIDDPAIGPVGAQLNAGSQPMLRGTIRDVSRAKLERIALAAADYMRTHPGSTVEGVSAFATAESCAPHEQEARAAAIADAHRKAQAIAALAGVSLEGIAAVNEVGGCPVTGDNPMQGYAPYGVPLDLTTLTASVSITETVLFATSAPPPPARRRTL